MENFNSNHYFQRLKKVGFTEEQAQVQIDELADVRTELRTEITKPRQEMYPEISHLHDKIDKVLIKINTAKWQTLGSIFSLLFFLPFV
jgi:signal recognition particle subunit SEC65